MDYLCNAGAVSFPIGSVLNDVQAAVTEILPDNIVENSENFFGSLGNGGATNVMINSTRNQTDITIQDETVAEFGWLNLTNSFSESDGTVSLSVQLLNDVVLARDLDVLYNCSNGSAIGKGLKLHCLVSHLLRYCMLSRSSRSLIQYTLYCTGAGVDYLCNAGAITFPIGSIQGAIETAIPEIVSDNVVENDEEFFSNLENGGTTGVMIDSTRSQTEVTIVDETVAEFGWRDLNYSFSESDGNVSLFIQLLNNVVLARDLAVQYSCSGGSAIGK